MTMAATATLRWAIQAAGLLRMETSPHVAGLERNRAEFLQEAAEVVRSATAIGRAITADEDSRVLEVTNNAHIIEEELLRLRRHHNEWKAGRFGPSIDGLRPVLSYVKSDSPRGVCLRSNSQSTFCGCRRCVTARNRFFTYAEVPLDNSPDFKRGGQT
jgi:hypothetical protein